MCILKLQLILKESLGYLTAVFFRATLTPYWNCSELLGVCFAFDVWCSNQFISWSFPPPLPPQQHPVKYVVDIISNMFLILKSCAVSNRIDNDTLLYCQRIYIYIYIYIYTQSKTCLKRNAIVPVFFFPFSQVSVLQRVVF